MTKDEEQTIRNIIDRLREPNCGCSLGPGFRERVEQLNPSDSTFNRIEAVSRIYIDTWLIGALELLLPEQRNPALARDMSRR